MGVLGESSVVLIPSVNQTFGFVGDRFGGRLSGDDLNSNNLGQNGLSQSGGLSQGSSPSASNRFHSSPPERIGLAGEYDYNGLAKRVMHCFRQNVGDEVSQLKVRQRGCVVILTGIIPSRILLTRLVTLATKVEGAALVELYRVTFTEDDAVITCKVS